MFQTLKSWLTASNTKPTPRRSALQVEALQDRIVPSAVLNSAGNIVINSGNGNDTVIVSVNYVLPTSKGGSTGSFVGPMVSLNTYRVIENGFTTDFPFGQVTGGKIMFNGNAGNDRFENRTSLGAIADGGDGNDTLIGGSSADILSGGSGADNLSGNGGADKLYGDTATRFDDTYLSIRGGVVTHQAYANILRGGDGADLIHGASGADVIDGGYGDDRLYGHDGNDRIYAADGVPDFGYNFIDGGNGHDTLTGGDGNDFIFGGDGDDMLKGGGGNDTLNGGDGTDTLFGDAGDDTLEGGDSLYGDRLFGGSGYDTAKVIAGRATAFECESVRVINVPTDSPQTEFWDCGPNSAYRFLKSYGYDVTYPEMRGIAEEQGIISDFGLGTTSDTLLEVLQEKRPYTVQEKDQTTGRMIELLLEGKPVIALVSLGKQFVGVGSVGKLHYVVMTGYDTATDTFFYTNTNGAEESWTRAQFEDNWDWHDDFTYGGEAAQATLRALGMKNHTLFY